MAAQLMTPKEDLLRSGLSEETIAAMQVRKVSVAKLEELGLQIPGIAYSFPYFDFDGNPIKDYERVRLLPPIKKQNGDEIKYLQAKGTGTHAYLPPIVDPHRWFDIREPLIITEGEKKAAKACQEGLLCMGLGGVESWRSRTFKFKIKSLNQSGRDPDEVSVRIDGAIEAESILEQVIEELMEIPLDGRLVYIAYDSDALVNPDVQRAAFELSVWLQNEGATVQQIVLPHKPNPGKMGLDDYLQAHTVDEFWRLRRTLPEHPKLRAWIRRLLDAKKPKRSDHLKCARAVVNALDVRGRRFVDPSNGSYYYWDERTNILHAFRWEQQELRQLRLSSFGSFVQGEFGVGSTDSSLMGRVADLYASGEIAHVTPRRVSWSSDDTLYYQVSDSFVARVSSRKIEVVNNGTDDVLFLAGQVEPLNLPPRLLAEDLVEKEGPRWLRTLQEVNIQPMESMSLEETHAFIAGLYYLSPWFRRWRGLMLPVELIISEPNSGKTFLYNLRKAILTGRPTLSNAPTNLRDWYSQLTSAPGLWVCDNMGELSKDLREGMSDELARLTTDPEPKVEMRKLYTTIETGMWPIDSCFAITSIRNPFWKPDILQRSAVIGLKAIPIGKRDSSWYQRQMANDGRSRWVADHLHMARRFLREVEQGWDDYYLSSHRLVHFEQSLLMMGRAMGGGAEELMKGAISKLFTAIQHQVSSHDPILECLKVFVQEFWEKNMKGSGGQDLVTTTDITRWAQQDPDERFAHLRMVANPVALGRYMGTHEYDIQEAVGLAPIKRHNQNFYRVRKPKEEKEEQQ